jgi:RNA recognition motif-containing protein
MATSHATLYLGDLSRSCFENDIVNLFSEVGTVIDVKIIRSKNDNNGIGYGFVTLSNKCEANLAIEKFSNIILHGRPLRMNWAARHIRDESNPLCQEDVVINSIYIRFNTKVSRTTFSNLYIFT